MLVHHCRISFHVAAALLAVGVMPARAIAQRDLTDIPDPDPVAEQAAMNVHELAAVNLFAADPDLSKPIQINFDATGGLWIASSEVYPQIKPGEIANDKIIVLRDTDGDGVSDQRTVFADGLLIPTGVIPDGPHAAYVAESTRLLYLQDTDHDGKADKRRVVLSGFGTEDTHHLVHTLRFGPDGCLYFNQSIYIHSHIQTPLGTRHLDGGGIWRYRPSTGRLEIVSKGFVNPWGHAFDPVGESFATDGAYFEGINYVFPDSVFVTSPGATRWLKGLNPGSPKHCGLEILSGTHIPAEWSGDLVTNDFRSHRVCRFTLKPSESGYISRQQPEIIRTEHVAFRPIDVRMGPDGAVYVADWYNPIIQHGEVDFRDDRRDREHGRIWRISFPDRALDPWPNFTQPETDGLLELLEDPALAVRQFARQELWNRASDAPEEVLAAATRWADSKSSSRILELSWLGEVVGREDLYDVKTLDAIDPLARRTYLRSLWRRRLNVDADLREAIETLLLGQVTREDPRVRLEAVVCAGQLNATENPEAILAVLAAASLEVDDNLDFAIWQSIRSLDASYANGTVLTAHDWRQRPAELARAVSAIGTPAAAEVAVKIVESDSASRQSVDALIQSVALAGDADQLGRVARALLSADPDNLSVDRLGPMLERTKRDGTIPQDVGEELVKISRQSGGDIERLETLATIAAAWKIEALDESLVAAVSSVTGQARVKIIESLGAFSSQSVKQLLSNLAKDSDPTTRVAATTAIASRRPGASIELIADLLAQENTADAGAELVVSQLNRKEMPGLLAAEIAKRELPTDRARNLLRRVRSAGGNEALEKAIQTAGKLENAAWTLTPELSEDILRLVKTEGSAERGESIYRREKLQCIQCHAIGVGGGLVGPNLISVGGSSQPDYVLESLLQPSAKLKEGYTTLSVLTGDGVVVNGIVIGRSDESVQMRLADGKEIQIATDNIELEKPGKSLMPEGLLDSLTKSELVDLTTFMVALGREPAFTVSTEPVARLVETLIYSDEANRRLNRTSTDTAASDDPTMKWRLITSKVDGTIPIQELEAFQQHRETPPTSFLRLTIEMPNDGVAKIQLPTPGIEAWVDTKPTPIWDLQSLQLPKGKHTIVLAVDRTVQPDALSIRISGDAIEAK